MKGQPNTQTKVDRALVDAAMRAVSAITAVPVAYTRKCLRERMVVFGARMGVDLREASDRVFGELEIGFWTFVVAAAQRTDMTAEEWTISKKTDEIFNEAARQAIRELLGDAEIAS